MTDILVVGAGPVGLTGAIELKRRGADVRIVEQRTMPSAESRALGINPRTLDILEPAGTTSLILQEGIRINRARMLSRGRSIGTIKFSAIDHRYPFVTALPQSRTEVLLEETLAGLGVTVERGVRYLGNAGTVDEPVARLETGAGEETVVCGRLLGCDGPHSQVRQDAGIAFEGEAFEHKWSLMDVEIDWPYPPDEACFIFSGTGNLFVLPVSPGVWRFVVPGEDIEGAIPEALKPKNILWQSQFRIAHRLASALRTGSMFLAGDSAHVHSPAGARGMNGGIEDAATFAWLFARDQLDRYSDLRREAARGVLQQVERQSRQAQSTGAAMLGPREMIGRLALSTQFVQRFAARFITAQDTPKPEWL